MTSLVLREERNGTAVLTLNRPDKGNALSKDLFEELEAHLDDINRRKRDIGLVILRGAGGNFSVGYDMLEMRDQVKAHAKPHYQSEVIDKLANLPQPVIAAIEGHCSTGALELALAADLIIASESAKLSEVYGHWGLTPIWGLTLRLPNRVGSAKAKEMLLSCRTYTGKEAHDMHLVNFYYPDDAFEAELAALADDILANSWFANRVIKFALTESEGLSLKEAHALEMFKDEGLAPDAEARIAEFANRKQKGA